MLPARWSAQGAARACRYLACLAMSDTILPQGFLMDLCSGGGWCVLQRRPLTAAKRAGGGTGYAMWLGATPSWCCPVGGRDRRCRRHCVQQGAHCGHRTREEQLGAGQHAWAAGQAQVVRVSCLACFVLTRARFDNPVFSLQHGERCTLSLPRSRAAAVCDQSKVGGTCVGDWGGTQQSLCSWAWLASTPRTSTCAAAAAALVGSR